MLEYEFLRANNIDEAVEKLDNYKKVKIIAGGTDILVEMHKEDIDSNEMDYLLDISNVNEFKFIRENEKNIEIGPLTTHSELVNNKIINENYGVLAQAALTIGSTQIRNRGTIAGNIVNASPAADLLSPLIALEAKVLLKSVDGERQLSIPEFITGPYSTDLKDNELLTKIIIPKLNDKYYSIFKKVKRRKAVDIARLNMAIVTKIENNNFEDIRIVPGSATPSPQAFSEIENLLEGKNIDNLNYDYYKEKIAEEMVAITGERWSTPYKKPAIGSILKKSLSGIIKEVENNA
ncbi:MAG: FAD binding domain-containing protein [Halanaerobiales bacterium]